MDDMLSTTRDNENVPLNLLETHATFVLSPPSRGVVCIVRWERSGEGGGASSFSLDDAEDDGIVSTKLMGMIY